MINLFSCNKKKVRKQEGDFGSVSTKAVYIAGQVRQGRGGLRPVNRAVSSKVVSSSGRRKMVVDLTHPQEEATRCAKAVSQEKQGQGVSGSDVRRKKHSW